MNETSKKRILIIEDNIDILELYKIYFEKAGFEVLLSKDGLRGIASIVETFPDIILLDIMMPEMNGFEVLEVIQTQSSIKIPIVVCSNLSQESDIARAKQLGATLYITKSDFEVPKIVEKVQEVLRNSLF